MKDFPIPPPVGSLSFFGRGLSWFGLVAACVGTFWVAEAMTGTGIALVSCLVLLLSALLVRRSCYIFHLKRTTITAFWYVSYLAMIFFPAFVIYFDQQGPYRGRYLFAVESVLITVPFGWLLSSAWFRFRKEEIDLFFELPIEETSVTSLRFRRCWVLLAVCLTLTGLYLIEVRTVPLFYLLRNPGEFLEAAVLREESLKLLNSPFTYLYYLARGVLYPLVILIALGSYLWSRQRKWLLLLAIATTAGLFFAALSLAKAPVAMIVLMIGIFFYLRNRGSFSKKAIAILLVLIMLFPLFIITYAYSDESVDILVALGAVGYRLFYIPAEAVYYYFEYFPDHVGYLHGRSIGQLARVLGEQPYDTTNEVGNYAFYTGIESVSANCAFIGDMNADFGMWGVLFGGVLAGIIMQAVQIVVLRRSKTVITLACLAFLYVAFWFLQSTSLPVVLASDGVILSLLIMWYVDRPAARPMSEPA